MARGRVASRSFVRAAHGEIMYAQLALRCRRAQETTPVTTSTPVSAGTTKKAAISCQILTDKSDSSAPIACNLSTFHVLVIYPGIAYVYNQISGELTQQLDLRRPAAAEISAPPLLNSPATGFVQHSIIDLAWVTLRRMDMASLNKKNETESSEQGEIQGNARNI
jgi:hypothetical protein